MLVWLLRKCGQEKKEKKKKKSEVLNSLFGTPDKKIDIKHSACSNFVSFFLLSQPQHLSLPLSIKESFTRLSPAVKDVGGREMRVRFSTDMNFRRRNSEALNSAPMRNLIFESPYKLYVGNLAWAIKPEDLRNHFSQFGTVVSARVVHDRKAGKHRAYGFLSFSSAAECEAAMSLNGKVHLHFPTV